MRPPSEPAINKDNPKMYFIFWNHDVPQSLWEKYKRKRIRIKIYDDVNRYKGQEREEMAEKICQAYHYLLFHDNYNPFEKELIKITEVQSTKDDILIKVVEKETVKPLSFEQQRKLTSIAQACDLWVESRKQRTTNNNSVSTYRVTASWFKKYFEALGRQNEPANSLSRVDITAAIMKAKADKGWEATTFNNERDTLNNLFNWLEDQEYIDTNVIRGKIPKIQTQKHKHKWFDKNLKALVKKQLMEDNEELVYRVMQFTYMILIRSKGELMKLKIGDIDRHLKRVRFSADLSKNNSEAYRDYPPEFEAVLDEMKLNSYPSSWYVFGRGGQPSEFKCHKDLFADRWRVVRDKLGLSDDYTIYGMKHTRIVHELFKGTDGYDISNLARHDDPKSTKDYMRDYDITLRNKYKPEDLCF